MAKTLVVRASDIRNLDIGSIDATLLDRHEESLVRLAVDAQRSSGGVHIECDNGYRFGFISPWLRTVLEEKGYLKKLTTAGDEVHMIVEGYVPH